MLRLFKFYINKLCLKKFLEIVPSNALDLISDFSMTAYGLVFLSNEIIINKRKNIIEFGSGISTIYLALSILKHNLNGNITTIENDAVWFERVKSKLAELQLTPFVNLIYAPLMDDVELGKSNKWYNSAVIDKRLNKSKPFDMVVVDGPSAFEPDIELSRYRAIPYLYNMLAKDNAVFLDDANRNGENAVIKLWREQFGLDFKTYNNRIAVCRNGVYKNSHPSHLSILTR